MTHFSLYKAENQISTTAITMEQEVGTRKREVKTIVEGIDEFLKREMGHHDSKEIQHVVERIEELHKEIPCSLVTSVEEDLIKARPPLITPEGHVTSQGLVMFDESKERIEEEPETLVWDSSRLPSHSHEFAVFKHI